MEIPQSRFFTLLDSGFCMAIYLKDIDPPFIQTPFCGKIDICFCPLIVTDDIYKGKRNMKEDIQITAEKNADGLTFTVGPPIGNLDVDKESNSYHFISCMIYKMIKDYDENPQKISFIGDRKIIEYSLIYMLDSFNKYQDNVLMSDLMPYMRHAKI